MLANNKAEFSNYINHAEMDLRLIAEQHEPELHGSTYMGIFFNKYSQSSVSSGVSHPTNLKWKTVLSICSWEPTDVLF